MTNLTQFLIMYGLPLLFVAVFAEQMGLPLPGYPWLLAAGALAAEGKLSFIAALAIALIAYLLADIFWFYLGRYRGHQVLLFFCRISPEPASCVRRKEHVFAKYGLRSALVSKFLPGLSQIVDPIAGMTGIRVGLFIGVDIIGSLFYGGTMLGLGYVFSHQLEQIITIIVHIGGNILWLLIGLVILYFSYKYFKRKRLLHKFKLENITSSELNRKLDAGESVVILDVSSKTIPDYSDSLIPKVIHLTPDQLDHHLHDIPHNQDIIVYCSCQKKEAPETRIALRLQRNGFKHVRPMSGDIEQVENKIIAQDSTTFQDQTTVANNKL